MIDKINTKVFSSVLKDVFISLEITEHLEFLDKDYVKVFENWKNSMKTFSQEKYMTWLEQTIEKRVDGVINGNYRKSYYKVAVLVVALDEVLTFQEQISKGEYIALYQKKYSRKRTFKQEILNIHVLFGYIFYFFRYNTFRNEGYYGPRKNWAIYC